MTEPSTPRRKLISMGGSRRIPATSCLLKAHSRCSLAAGALEVDCWTEARLLSASSIEVDAAVFQLSCPVLEALSTVLSLPVEHIPASDGNSPSTSAITALRRFAVRRSSMSTQMIDHAEAKRPGAQQPALSQAVIELWAELDVQVRPNSPIWLHPELKAAWTILLSGLVDYSYEEAPFLSSPITPAPTACNKFSRTAKVADPAGGESHVGKVHPLEHVYTSLEPKTLFCVQGSKAKESASPSLPVACLNAIPVALAMKVAHFLPASSLDALSSTCKELHEIYSALVPGLTLDLFPHQTEGLLWMRDRERGGKSRQHPEYVPVEASHCPQNVPAQISSSAQNRDSSSEGGCRLAHKRLWVNVVDGVVRVEAPAKCRPVRGGLLCDEPGLGKTITVLALLLRTKGLLPEGRPAPFSLATSARSGSGSATPEQQWRLWGSMEREKAMMKVVRTLQAEDPAGLFSRELDEDTLRELGMPDYGEIVGSITDLWTIARRASSGPRDSRKPYDDFEEFASDVRRVFSNAVLYHGRGAIRQSSSSQLADGNTSGEVQKRVRAIPNVAQEAIRLSQIAEQLLGGVFVPRRTDRAEALAERLRNLKPAASTLIVVPPPMLPHWRLQLTTYAEPGRLGPLFIDERSDFVLPPANELAAYGVVVTTYQRLTNEQPRWNESPLSQIYWLRMVLDEGHAMGTSAVTSCGDVARRVEAERRWVMTGTPTRTTSADAALRNLSNLLLFLREREYAPDWRRNIRGPFIAGRPEGRERLRSLLSEVMIRHTKRDVLAIPSPVRESTLLRMSQQESLAYDTIVSFVRSNLLLTSMEGKTSGWQDSLLNPANTKYAMEALHNIRLSCCGGGTLIPVVKRQHHLETLEMLRDIHATSTVDLTRIDNFINRATTGEISSCQVCVDCVDCVNHACRVCGSPYDIDDFQRIQPGFELKWMYNVREQERLHQQRRAAARLQNQALQTSQSAQGSPARTMHAPREAIGTVANPASPSMDQGLSGGGALGVGQGDSGSRPESGASSPGAGGVASPGLDDDDGEELEMHSKAFHAIEQLKNIRKRAAEGRRGSETRPIKAIVFSQFLTVLNIVGDKFLREFGGYPAKGWDERGMECVAEFWGKNRAKELERFRTDPSCFVLLLGKRGAHGLDLSFVTHMFLMDQIWDRSLETQVVARANRMGAKGSVSVVQLVMKDTMEEELRSYVNRDDGLAEGVRCAIPSAEAAREAGHKDRNAREEGERAQAETPPARRRARRDRSPWETRRKRARRTVPGKASSSTAQQEHAKVHFLLTSLRSSTTRVSQPRSSEREKDEEADQSDEDSVGGAGSKGKGKARAKTKAPASMAPQAQARGGKGKAIRRRVVTFEDVVDAERPQQPGSREGGGERAERSCVPGPSAATGAEAEASGNPGQANGGIGVGEHDNESSWDMFDQGSRGVNVSRTSLVEDGGGSAAIPIPDRSVGQRDVPQFCRPVQS